MEEVMGLADFLRSTLSNASGNIIQSMKEIAQDDATQQLAVQQESKDSFQLSTEELTNPFGAQAKRHELASRSPKTQKLMHAADSRAIDPIARLKEMADNFNRRNPELKAEKLIRMRNLITKGMSKEQILEIIQDKDFFPDVTLADEALDFLIEETEGDPELQGTIKEAKADLRSKYEREIIAGKNIENAARQASEKGLGTTSNLRDMYRDITNNPRDSVSLFQELANKYAFKDLNKVIAFLLHALGSDLKSNGPSISRGLLHRLFTETRSLQAILGVYRFFRNRMGLMQGLFSKNHETLPPQITFEAMAKHFMAMAGDRYPSGEKVLQSAVRLGIDKWLLAKIIVFSQFRDAVKEVAVNQIYASLQHRDELYMAIIDALEGLEEAWEEEHDTEEDEDDEKDEKDEPKTNPKS